MRNFGEEREREREMGGEGERWTLGDALFGGLKSSCQILWEGPTLVQADCALQT